MAGIVNRVTDWAKRIVYATLTVLVFFYGLFGIFGGLLMVWIPGYGNPEITMLMRTYLLVYMELFFAAGIALAAKWWRAAIAAFVAALVLFAIVAESPWSTRIWGYVIHIGLCVAVWWSAPRRRSVAGETGVG